MLYSQNQKLIGTRFGSEFATRTHDGDMLRRLMAIGASVAVIARLLPGLSDEQLRAVGSHNRGVMLGAEL